MQFKQADQGRLLKHDLWVRSQRRGRKEPCGYRAQESYNRGNSQYKEPEPEVVPPCSSKCTGENTAKGRKAGKTLVGVMVIDILGPPMHRTLKVIFKDWGSAFTLTTNLIAGF